MIHPTAITDGATVPENAHVWQYATVMPGAILGEFVSIGGHTEIGRYCNIGARTRIGYGCFLPNKVQVGERVFIGPRVVMCDDRKPVVNDPFYKAEPPVIEDDVSIGAGAVILPGRRLGRGCRIGAGATVAHDVEPYGTVVGPAAVPLR